MSQKSVDPPVIEEEDQEVGASQMKKKNEREPQSAIGRTLQPKFDSEFLILEEDQLRRSTVDYRISSNRKSLGSAQQKLKPQGGSMVQLPTAKLEHKDSKMDKTGKTKTLLTNRQGWNSNNRLVYKQTKIKPVFQAPRSKHLKEIVPKEVNLQQMSASSLMMQLAKASLTKLKGQPKLTKQALKNIETYFALEYDDLQRQKHQVMITEAGARL